MVPLSAKNVLKVQNAQAATTWNSLILDNLRKSGTEYTHMKSIDLVGCLITMFVKSELAHKVTKIEADLVKQGFKGKLGNKGGVLIRCNFDDTSMVFWNCHLASG